MPAGLPAAELTPGHLGLDEPGPRLPTPVNPARDDETRPSLCKIRAKALRMNSFAPVVAPVITDLASQDEATVGAALEKLEGLLEQGARMQLSLCQPDNECAAAIDLTGGVAALDDLRSHPSDDTAQWAVDILDGFFLVDEAADSEAGDSLGSLDA